MMLMMTDFTQIFSNTQIKDMSDTFVFSRKNVLKLKTSSILVLSSLKK